MNDLKKYKMPIIGLLLSILVVFASMNIWILTILSPIFVFLVLKFLKIWRSKERLVIGIPAIFLGIMLFFAVFSYQISEVPKQHFSTLDNSLEVTVSPYITSDFSKRVYINATYEKGTNSSLSYVVRDMHDRKVISFGEVEGNVSGNITSYHLILNLTKGIYAINLTVENTTLVVAALKAKTLDIFLLYLKTPGVYLMVLLSSLYALFIFGIHIIRKAQKKGMVYEKKKEKES